MTTPVPAAAPSRWLLQRDALNRLWRTVLQGLVVTAVVAAFDAGRQLLGAGPVDWRQLGYVAGSAAGMVVVTYAATAIRTGRLEPIPLRLDALVRTGRTLLVGAAVTGGAAAVEVVRAAIASDVEFSPTRVAVTALTAAAMAIAAYLHRTALDPTGVPSATPPPAPPGGFMSNDPGPAAGWFDPADGRGEHRR